MCRNIREKRGVYSGRTGPFFTCVPSAVLVPKLWPDWTAGFGGKCGKDRL